jgi:hypothetical protein
MKSLKFAFGSVRVELSEAVVYVFHTRLGRHATIPLVARERGLVPPHVTEPGRPRSWLPRLNLDAARDLQARFDRAIVERLLPRARVTSVEELVAEGWSVAVPRDDLLSDLEKLIRGPQGVRFEDFVAVGETSVKEYVPADRAPWATIKTALFANRVNPDTKEIERVSIHALRSADGIKLCRIPCDDLDMEVVMDVMTESLSPRFWRALRKLCDLLRLSYDRESFGEIIAKSEAAHCAS